MLIDSFADDLAPVEPNPSLGQYLLIDGAFVPGLHRMVADDDKRILFESLPGCSENTRDVSPFLTRFELGKKRPLSRCDRWPMVSVIETSETLDELSERLGAWCIVEADGDRFNFRFADTRRLPTIYRSLTVEQRGEFAGPALRWHYIARDGRWRALELDSPGTSVASNPALDEAQFARLVDDSRADEILRLLRDRGHDVYRQPSRSHALLEMALKAAAVARLEDSCSTSWCEWFWQEDQLHDSLTAVASLNAWRIYSIQRDDDA